MEKFKSFRFCSKQNQVSKSSKSWRSGNSVLHSALQLQAIQILLILFTWQSGHTCGWSTASQDGAPLQPPCKGQVHSVGLSSFGPGCPNFYWVGMNCNPQWAPTWGLGIQGKKDFDYTSCAITKQRNNALHTLTWGLDRTPGGKIKCIPILANR